MAQHDFVVKDDDSALHALDIHYGMLLGCSMRDLRRPGWTVVPARAECDPMALLFGQRLLLSLVVPREQPDGPPGAAGVVAVAPELRGAVATLLRVVPPEELCAPVGLELLNRLLASALPAGAVTAAHEAHTRIRYASAASFQPYRGQWQEWIEPLDEASELDPSALGLLARYSGGVYVVRDRGAIVSFAGIRPHSPHIAEIGVRTDAEALRGHGLARAVVARATKAVLAGDRLPLYRHAASNAASERVAASLGYRVYAEAVEYYALGA